MPAPKPRGRQGGRKKGVPNKVTAVVRAKFEEVFTLLQADTTKKNPAALCNWAKANPGEFYKLAAKLIPLQVIGDPSNPLYTKDVSTLSDAELEALAEGKVPG